jgi:putative endonuclease
MPEAWVYLLRCRDDSLYTGWTVDLQRRLARHRDGTASRYTASRLPIELALAIPMPDRTAARREEARIKRLPRAAKLALLRRPVADEREYLFAVVGDERRADALDRSKLGHRTRP